LLFLENTEGRSIDFDFFYEEVSGFFFDDFQVNNRQHGTAASRCSTGVK
jgi:hypothetical protein